MLLSEAQLRDLIAENIAYLKSGLTLLEKEKYIPNRIGTRSFIDLYATDPQNRHVLIEIKKSDATAREALHEIIKYVEGAKNYLKAKESEIHVIIASTEWNELLVPYSRFVNDSNISIEGIVLKFTDDKKPFSAESVSPLSISRGRIFAPWHQIRWYSTKNELENGIGEIEKYYRRIGIDDFVVISLKLKHKMNEDERRQFDDSVDAFLKTIGRNATESEDQNERIFIPQHEFCAYSAKQMLDVKTCVDILRRNKGTLRTSKHIYTPTCDALMEDINLNAADEETLMMLNTKLDDIPPFPKGGYVEIAYPAKIAELLQESQDGCDIIEVKRYGAFARNTRLSDETIISELKGKDGNDKNSLSTKVNISNKAEVQELRNGIDDSLQDNPTWRRHLHQIIDEIISQYPDAEIGIKIFNPSTGLHTIYHVCRREDPESYLPRYSVTVDAYAPKVKDVVRVAGYYGLLCKQGKSMSYEEMLLKYFDNHVESLIGQVVQGGYDSRDVSILKDFGLTYRSFKIFFDWSAPQIQVIGSNVRLTPILSSFSYSSDGWKEDRRFKEPLNPIDVFNEYYHANNKNVTALLEDVERYDRDDFFVIHI